MKLITETTHEVQLVSEAKEDGSSKNYFIEGIFMQADKKNRNGRRYPGKILEKEVKRYNKTYVEPRRAMGELGHPDGPTVNLERVSHLIENLNVEGSDVIGRAKILETPYGKIVKNLMDEGAKLGVSSRGMGSLKQKGDYNEVQDDFMLSAVDIVADPSAPDAFVNGIMEGKEWVWDSGILKEKQIEEMRREVRKASARDLSEAKLNAFKKFISKL
tara:strand:- start:385 stop:1032 length:648 start_codon:yes stop_codon:yes gene_type:complete